MNQYRSPSMRRLATAFMLSFASLSSAVTLSNFSPEAVNLTPGCNYVYQNTNIEGCSAADFTAGSACSQSCIQGMVQLNDLVIQECKGNSQNEQFIIAAFLSGQGIQSLCPNVDIVTTPQTESPTAVPSSSSGGGQATITSGTFTEPSPTANTSGGLIIDTSSSPQPSGSATPSIPLTISTSCTDSAQATTTTAAAASSFVTSFKPTSLPIATSAQPSSSSGLLEATRSSQPSTIASASSSSCVEGGGTLFGSCSITGAAAAPLANSMMPVWAGMIATLCISLPVLLFP